MDLLNFFYTNNLGRYPNDINKINITKDTINYLKDCNVPIDQILYALLNSKDRECLYPDTLTSKLWENSLIQQNRYYFHNTLQIISKAPEINIQTGQIITYPFYKEIKIIYTLDDLLNYFYDILSITEIIDKKKDIGRLKYIFNKYSVIKDIGTLDILLTMIDLSLKNNKQSCINNIMNIDDNASEAINLIRKWQREAKLTHTDKIIWRGQRWMTE